MPLDPKPQRRAMPDREILPVHAVGQDRLRMKRINEVDSSAQ
jgi:hypothetical protein